MLLQGQIKQLLTGLMLNTPPLVRAQLSEALTLISNHDFPTAWPQLLPELVERLAGGAGGRGGGAGAPAAPPPALDTELGGSGGFGRGMSHLVKLRQVLVGQE
jgi:hypothetical protein